MPAASAELRENRNRSRQMPSEQRIARSRPATKRANLNIFIAAMTKRKRQSHDTQKRRVGGELAKAMTKSEETERLPINLEVNR